MPEEMVATCCSRFAIADAEVALEDPMRDLRHSPRLTASELINSFIPMVTSFSGYWHRYVHGYCYNHVNSDFTVDELKELAALTRGLDAPFLHELVLNYSQDALKHSEKRPQQYQDAVHYFTTWAMPRLASLVTVNLIPRPFQLQNSPSLKKLNMSLDYSRQGAIFSLRELSSFLSPRTPFWKNSYWGFNTLIRCSKPTRARF